MQLRRPYRSAWPLHTLLRVVQWHACEGERLTQRKLGALNLVVLLDLPPDACVKLLLAGASDPSDAVLRRGEELLKKRCVLTTQYCWICRQTPA